MAYQTLFIYLFYLTVKPQSADGNNGEIAFSRIPFGESIALVFTKNVLMKHLEI
jgi:hypothetical protein